MRDVIVIGGGPAGVTAALRARELGASVKLIERDRMGGTCTNDGCVPTRVLAKAARLVRDAEQFRDYGLQGAKPTVDLPALLGRTQQTVFRLQEKKQLIDHLRQAGVSLTTNAGAARFLDEQTIQFENGQRLTADNFILCVGGHARRLTFPGSEYTLTHSDVWSLTQLPRSVAVVGAAATGCQLASILAAFGVAVTLLDLAPRILPGEDTAVSQTVHAGFQARGISVVTGIGGIDRIEKVADGLRLLYGHDGQARELDVAQVIMAVGWVGNTDHLNLAAAGVHTERSYVVVDDTLRTSNPRIYAAGDVNGRMMLVQSASAEARQAVENALLGQAKSFRHHIVPHGGFTDPEYGSVGLTEAEALAEEGCAMATIPYSDLDRAVIDGRPEGFCKLIVKRASGQIVGAHVVGEQAVEVVQIVAAGMAAGMHVLELAELELAYPTFTAVVGLAARQLVRQLGLTPLAAEWRTLHRLKSRSAEWENSTP
jgi:dihydrolipoamide dehydrogenase